MGDVGLVAAVGGGFDGRTIFIKLLGIDGLLTFAFEILAFSVRCECLVQGHERGLSFFRSDLRPLAVALRLCLLFGVQYIVF